jgi:hypothetical protein
VPLNVLSIHILTKCTIADADSLAGDMCRQRECDKEIAMSAMSEETRDYNKTSLSIMHCAWINLFSFQGEKLLA